MKPEKTLLDKALEAYQKDPPNPLPPGFNKKLVYKFPQPIPKETNPCIGCGRFDCHNPCCAAG